MLHRLLALPALTILLGGSATAGDWPHVRGPQLDGRVEAPGTFDADEIGLELAWRVPLGSAYSGVVVADDRAVTMFADNEGDWVAAFSAKDGKEIWRYRMGDPTRGLDGSDDGPLSSPAIGGERVYAVGSTGRVAALRLSDGKLAWSAELAGDQGGVRPHFGFATSPLLSGSVLVVQAGGSEGRSIVGLDTRNGRRLWSHGDGKVDYQSPALMTLGGVEQIVAVSADGVSGLASRGGKPLWHHPLGEGDRASSANPAFVGDDRFLILMRGGAGVFRVRHGSDGFAVEELYRTNALGGGYSPPVYHDGHIFGFRGQVLTCIDAASGERIWRSRPPGGDGLILVDGHLVVFGARGAVVVAEATPEGYRELARVQALDGSSLTWPSFADGRIFVRNLDDMAAVRITHRTSPTAQRTEGDHAFGRWLLRTRDAADRGALVEELWRQHPQLPIVEGEYVHFLYRGAEEDVAIAGSMIDAETTEPMERLEGTDLFHRTYRLEPGGRWEYRFQVDFEHWKVDPRNPRTVPAAEGDEELSELVAPGYRLAAHLTEPRGARGRVETFGLSSAILGYEKQIRVWLPPEYDDGDRHYPLLVVNDGHAWLDRGSMATSLDNLVGKQVEPLIVAFLDAHPSWWTEAGGSRTAEYVRMQVEELLPLLGKRYRLEQAAERRGIMGLRFYGLSAVYAALEHPDAFGRAAVQSVYMGLGVGAEVESLIGAGAGSAVRFYLDWNRYDERNVDRDWDLAEDSRSLADLLQKRGYRMQGGEVFDSGGWGGWRNRTDRVLSTLFPLARD